MSSPKITIREVIVSDLSQIAKLSRTQKIYPEFSSIQKIRLYFRTPPHNQGKLLVATVGNKIVGMSEVILGVYGQRGGYVYKPSYGSLIKFYILPSMFKAKLMGRLLRISEKTLIKMGVIMVFTDIHQHDFKMQQFLEIRGYEVVQRWSWKGNPQQRLKKIIGGR